ncbi:alginate export family protein [Novacetimonas hansenii]|uniref:alginate export family protein n=1 Tax=Novacetimonas hansenii TaxID=436 RepID=UPI001CE1F13B|nr:alginate export family protein [Novacetimonas hansenii]
MTPLPRSATAGATPFRFASVLSWNARCLLVAPLAVLSWGMMTATRAQGAATQGATTQGTSTLGTSTLGAPPNAVQGTISGTIPHTAHPLSPRTMAPAPVTPSANPAAIHSTTGIAQPESMMVHVGPRPPIQTYPHANPVGQPIVMTGAQNRINGHPYDWGVFNRGNGESAGFGPVGQYGIAPWAEDWSRLRNSTKHTDPFDVLKYIPLTPDGQVWISFSGETRLRNWFETRPNLGTQKPNDSGRFGVRNLYGADLHIGSHLRFFGQLINADAGGWGGYGYGSTYRKRLDAQQAFVETRWNLLGAKTGFMFGRQQFLDAPSYMLYNRETPNVPLSWDGFRAYAIWKRIRIDGWDFVQTNDSQNKMFHDTENYSTRLYGFDTTWAPPDFRFLGERGYSFVDAFYIGYKLSGSSGAIATQTGTATGSNTRNNFGVRWHGQAGPIEFSVGAVWQGGVFRYAKTNIARNVSAYAINSIVGYRVPKDRLHTFAGVQTDIYSGGNDARKNGDIGTYISPFNPQTNYLDTTTYMTASNLISVAPLVRITPFKSVSLQVKFPLFWRDSTNDRVYKSSGAYSFAGNFGGKFIGMAPQASLAWQINTHLSWTQYVSRFMTSRALNDAGGSSGTYYQSNFVFRF